MSDALEHVATRPLSEGRLAGKVALITGAGTAIGRAAASAFAREGAAVVLAGRREAELQDVAAAITTAGGRAAAIPTDVSSADGIAALVQGTLDRFGRLDAAFNNAGTMGALKPIMDLTVEDFDQVMAVNLRGVWLLVKHEIEAMLAQGSGGAIVNTSSFLSTEAAAGTSIYSASKAALDAMIRAVALEVGDKNIRINNINPGVIKTPMSLGYGEAALAPFAAHAALKRLGEPEDIGDVAAWLCTNEARFITGQSILIDGGFNIPGWR